MVLSEAPDGKKRDSRPKDTGASRAGLRKGSAGTVIQLFNEEILTTNNLCQDS
jgi:hypothetical protein